MRTLSEFLKAERLSQGLSVAEAAAAIGCAPSEIEEIEKGGTVRSETLFGIVNTLNIPPEAVLPYIESHSDLMETEDSSDSANHIDKKNN